MNNYSTVEIGNYHLKNTSCESLNKARAEKKE